MPPADLEQLVPIWATVRSQNRVVNVDPFSRSDGLPKPEREVIVNTLRAIVHDDSVQIQVDAFIFGYI